LEELDNDGNRIRFHALPAKYGYMAGRFVTWEWDHAKGIDTEAWFLNPDTNAPDHAWSEAATFDGRECLDQWGLLYRLNVFQPDDAG
jgi:hypothetical protein